MNSTKLKGDGNSPNSKNMNKAKAIATIVISGIALALFMVLIGVVSIIKAVFWDCPMDIWKGKEEPSKETGVPRLLQTHELIEHLEDSYIIMVDGQAVTPLIGEEEAWLLFDQWCDTLADQVDLYRVLDSERLLPVKGWIKGHGVLYPQLP